MLRGFGWRGEMNSVPFQSDPQSQDFGAPSAVEGSHRRAMQAEFSYPEDFLNQPTCVLCRVLGSVQDVEVVDVPEPDPVV